MKKIVTIILCSALVVISGCDNYDFAQEQFRKEVNLLSNSSLVYDRQDVSSTVNLTSSATR